MVKKLYLKGKNKTKKLGTHVKCKENMFFSQPILLFGYDFKNNDKKYLKICIHYSNV